MVYARAQARVRCPDPAQCACGGRRKLIVVIEESAVIKKIVMRIGLDPQPPPRAKARRVELFEAA
jgi:hypothetical protein